MSTNDRGTPSLVQMLWERGWRQGSLFVGDDLPFVRYDQAGSGVDLKRRRLKSGEKYVLATHDCDIVRSTDLEPFVEALLCKVEGSREFLQRIDSNRASARWFVIDPAAGLVACASYRIVIAKKALADLGAPQAWPSDHQRFAWFRCWLGYRFDRPSLEKHEEDYLKSPVEEVLEVLERDHPSAATAFYRAVAEVRVAGPTRTEAPYDFQLIFLTKSPALTQEQSEALEMVIGAVSSRCETEPIDLNEDVVVVALQEFPVSEYRQTWMLPLDQFTDIVVDEID